MAKKVTIKDIAREAGVSVALVSFVMNNRLEADGKPKYRVGAATRQHILEVAARMRYQPVERVLQRELRSLVAGVILPDAAAYAEFATALEHFAQAQGCTLLFGYTQGDRLRFRRLAELFLEKRVDGLVAIPPSDDLMEGLLNSGIPCVVPKKCEEALLSASECASRLFLLLEEK